MAQIPKWRKLAVFKIILDFIEEHVHIFYTAYDTQSCLEDTKSINPVSL